MQKQSKSFTHFYFYLDFLSISLGYKLGITTAMIDTDKTATTTNVNENKEGNTSIMSTTLILETGLLQQTVTWYKIRHTALQYGGFCTM